MLQQKAQGVARLATAIALIEAFFRSIRGLVLVKGAQGFVVAAFLLHFDGVVLEQLDQVDRGF